MPGRGRVSATRPGRGRSAPDQMGSRDGRRLDALRLTNASSAAFSPGRSRNDYTPKASIYSKPRTCAGHEPIFEDESSLRSYMRQMVASGELTVIDDARRLAARVLEGLPVPVVGPIANGLGRMLIAELLPAQRATGRHAIDGHRPIDVACV